MFAARIERVALRLRSDPSGGWEEDLRLVEVALPGLEAEPISIAGAIVPSRAAGS